MIYLTIYNKMEKTSSTIWKETLEKVRVEIRNEELETLIVETLRILKRKKNEM